MNAKIEILVNEIRRSFGSPGSQEWNVDPSIVKKNTMFTEEAVSGDFRHVSWHADYPMLALYVPQEKQVWVLNEELEQVAALPVDQYPSPVTSVKWSPSKKLLAISFEKGSKQCSRSSGGLGSHRAVGGVEHFGQQGPRSGIAFTASDADGMGSTRSPASHFGRGMCDAGKEHSSRSCI